jgi:hypothetical protein
MMKRAAKLSVIGLTLALVAVQCTTAEAVSNRGVLRGVIRDQMGSPLVGVTVAIFNAASSSEKPVNNAKTGDGGEFSASVAPGRYVLRAVASGFDTVEARARVAANRETVLDEILLRRANTLAERRRAAASDPYRQVVRSSRVPIFHADEQSPEAEEARDRANALALTDEDRSVHGVVQMVGTYGDQPYAATNFAVAKQVADTDVTVIGQIGAGRGAPQRLETSIRNDIGDDHSVDVTLGYGRLTVDGESEPDRLDQYTVQAVDRWRIAGPLVVVYGFNYTRFGGDSSEDALLPRFGVEFSPNSRTQIFSRLTPGASLGEIASFDLETGEVTFVEPARANRSLDRLDEASPDRSRRFEVGVGHLIDERSNVEVMAFVDTASGHGIGFLAVPAPGQDPEFRTGSLDGRTSGVRVLYTRRLGEYVTGTIGYSAGRGLALRRDGLANPASLVESRSFQVLAGQLQADFSTGTRISAIYRFSPGTVVFAIDPFAGKLAAYEPSASFVVYQSIPTPGFIPGQLEALLDVRNAFDSLPASDDGEVILNDYSRLVRAGLSFRF